MKLLEIPVRLPTYLFPYSEKYLMSCLRQSLSRREICTFKDGRSLQELSHHQPTKNTSMQLHIQARLDNEDWNEKHFFYPKEIPLKNNTQYVLYCNKVDKRRYSNWLLWCNFPKEKTLWHHYNQSTSPSIDNETTLILFLFLVGFHVKAGFCFLRENS